MAITRETQKLKELIFDTLTGDSALQTALGGSGKIFHGNPLNKSQYPCVCYSIINEEDDAYKIDQHNGVTRTRLALSIFSSDVSSKQSDDIEDAVYNLLHGKSLSNTDFMVYTCYRVSRTPVHESEIKVWRVESRYDLVNVTI